MVATRLSSPKSWHEVPGMAAGCDPSRKESGPRPPSAGPRPAQVSVTIKDSGPGLDPEHLDHLFDPFFSTKPHGLGIGLTITRSIVEAHGGRVSAKANLPRGAVFEFTLPVSAAGVQISNQSDRSGNRLGYR